MNDSEYKRNSLLRSKLVLANKRYAGTGVGRDSVLAMSCRVVSVTALTFCFSHGTAGNQSIT
jgi:hypothetical protein